ncbi:ABC transporter substrate-binding protein [Labrenzia sp. VG12]|uniref:substrate-binding periplasmic protein n=1 Tax=Labrenzia sp. VG12 TaxID=2021862 RepID=UPI000B8C4A78|nr:transporter substrate-binding domain-containing protein [Labrenzia sp. VG12]ASP33337.1 ABC transporter [Labrenzia sp. VG12]
MRTVLGIVFTAILAVFPAASAEKLKLTTLNWPPYVLEDGSGPNTDTVREIFARGGIDMEHQVFPWNRAIKLAADDPEWIGVYPEYYSEDIDAEKGGDRCLFSESFGVSPVGFLKRRDSDFTWSSHDDLKDYVIGVVRGYVNEDRLDHMIAAGEITAQLAEDDTQNILQVAAQRTDAIVIDRLVFEYLKSKMKVVATVAEDLEFHDKLLVQHGLYVCFENSAAGRAARQVFNSQMPDKDLTAETIDGDQDIRQGSATGG